MLPGRAEDLDSGRIECLYPADISSVHCIGKFFIQQQVVQRAHGVLASNIAHIFELHVEQIEPVPFNIVQALAVSSLETSSYYVRSKALPSDLCPHSTRGQPDRNAFAG